MKNSHIEITDCETISCPLCGCDESRPIASGLDTEYGTLTMPLVFVQCSECGHYYLNPRPGIDVGDRMYPRDYYTLSGRHAQAGSLLVAALKKRIIRRRLAYFNQLFAQPGTAILEVGCGDGSLLTTLKQAYPHLTCTGVDLTFSNHTRQACATMDIQLIEQPVESATIDSGAYDLVIMNQIIEHLWHPRPVLQKLHAALRRGGLISIETVNLDSYDRRLFAGGQWGGYYFPRHLNLFSKRSLSGLLEQAGFRVIKSYSLLAPIVWVFSLRAWMSGKFGNLPKIRRFLNDKNPLCLLLFAAIDMVALALKKTTSNQKIIARKS